MVDKVYFGIASWFSSAACFVLAALMLLFAVSRSHPFGNYTFSGALLLAPAVVWCAAGILRSPQQHATVQNNSNKLLLHCLVLTASLYHCLTVFPMLAGRPGTDIDVYVFQEHSAAAFLHGVNPYTLSTTNIYGRGTALYAPEILVGDKVQIGLPYPPASLFFVLPAYLLGDLRYAYVAAILLSVVILLMLRTDLATAGLACLILLSPVTRYVERQSWTEPFVLLSLTCTIYAALRNRWWLPIALGIFFASKQYSILALPYVPFLVGTNRFKQTWKLLASALGIATALTLPMAFWDFSGFWRNVVLFQIRQPFRKDALTIGNLLFPVPAAVIIGLVGIGTILALRRARPHPSMFAACYGFTLLIFVGTNKQAFCNYYFLIIYTLLLGAVIMNLSIAPETLLIIRGVTDRRRLWRFRQATADPPLGVKETKVTS